MSVRPEQLLGNYLHVLCTILTVPRTANSVRHAPILARVLVFHGPPGRARALRFDCGHLTVCKECAERLPARPLRQCPNCRAFTQGVGAAVEPHEPYYVHHPTYVPRLATLPTTGAAPVLAGAEIDGIVAVMRRNSGDAAVQQRACHALYQMTANDAEARSRAGAVGVLEAVVAAMRAHPQSQPMQGIACKALGTMILGNAENRIRAGAAGAMEAVVAVMRAHPQSQATQWKACRTLAIMMSLNAENRTRAGNAGAVEVAVAAMVGR